MKATGKSIYNGKTRNWRETINNVEEWIENRKDFLKSVSHYNMFSVTRVGNIITMEAHRNAQPRMKEHPVTYILTIVD